MFGKLLKNDLKAQWFSISVIYFCAYIAVVACELGAAIPLITKEILDPSTQKQIALCGGGVSLALTVASVATIIMVAVIFNNTMFGKSGYLTLTLPVKTGSLLISKTISGLIWVFTVYTLLIGSLILWLYQMRLTLGEQLTESVDDLLSLFGVPSVRTITIGVVMICVIFMTFILLVVQSLYSALTLSQVKPFSSFGKIGTIALFFILIAILSKLSSSVSDLLPINVIISETTILFTTNSVTSDATMNFRLTGALFNIVASIALHFPMKFLINKKINLK